MELNRSMPVIILNMMAQQLALHQYAHLLLKTVTLALPQSLSNLISGSITSYWVGFMPKPTHKTNFYDKTTLLFRAGLYRQTLRNSTLTHRLTGSKEPAKKKILPTQSGGKVKLKTKRKEPPVNTNVNAWQHEAILAVP